MSLVCSGLGVEDDDSMVHVTISHIQLACLFVDEHVRGATQVLDVVASAAHALTSDLKEELSFTRELQDLRVGLATAPQPNIVALVDVDAVLQFRPLVARSWTAPGKSDVSGGIEREHLRRGHPFGAQLVRLQRRRAVDDPDKVVPIDRDTGARAHDPLGSEADWAKADRPRIAGLHGRLMSRSRPYLQG